MSDILVQALCDTACYDHPVGQISIHETQISWILLTGDYTYKIKKSLDYGTAFDASTPDKRRKLCEREVRLNRRLLPARYLDVIPISGTTHSPRINDASAPIEYAVKMRRFSQRQLDNVLQTQGELSRELIDELILEMVDFHEYEKVPDTFNNFVSENASLGVTTSNASASTSSMLKEEFISIRRCLDKSIDELKDHQSLDELEQQACEMHARLTECFEIRQRDGFLRHTLGNTPLEEALHPSGKAWQYENRDESNVQSPVSDVAEDLAFLLMDLESRQAKDLANYAFNHYLELSGDYSLVEVLGFYKLYHALIRAKIAITGYSQTEDHARRCALIAQYHHYFSLSKRYSRFQFPYLMIGVGVPGSGKSRFTGEMVQRLGSVRLRSDVERNRLHGFGRGASGCEKAIYKAGTTARTYQRLAELSGILLKAGYTVCIDATCLKRKQRDLFRHQAESRGLAVIIVSFEADIAILQRRIKKRARRIGESAEPSLEILKRQLRAFDAFDDDERRYLVRLDTTANNASEILVDLIQQQVQI